jgi:hypothetical protein
MKGKELIMGQFADGVNDQIRSTAGRAKKFSFLQDVSLVWVICFLASRTRDRFFQGSPDLKDFRAAWTMKDMKRDLFSLQLIFSFSLPKILWFGFHLFFTPGTDDQGLC